MTVFYHDNYIDTLKLGCNLPNLANTCLHKSTDAKFYSFTQRDRDLLEKVRKGVVRDLSIVFTRKAVFDETLIRKPTKISKSIVVIDASQLYPHWVFQPMPVGFYTRWHLESERDWFAPRQNNTRSFEKTVISYFQRTGPECKIESFYTTGREKIECSNVDVFYSHCNAVYKASCNKMLQSPLNVGL